MWGSFESLSWSSVTSYVADVATTVQNSVTDAANSVQNSVNDALVQTTGDFNAFERDLETKRREQRRRERAAKLPPWFVGAEDKSIVEAELKERILAFAHDERVFLVNAPGDDLFAFNYDTALRYALPALEVDEALGHARFALVPKKVSESQFWRNYFYRVQLLREQLKVDPLQLVDDQTFDAEDQACQDDVAAPVEADSSSVLPSVPSVFAAASAAVGAMGAALGLETSAAVDVPATSAPAVTTPANTSLGVQIPPIVTPVPSATPVPSSAASTTPATVTTPSMSALLDDGLMSAERRQRAKQLEAELEADLDLADLSELIDDVDVVDEDIDEATLARTMRDLKADE